ncbi:MAG: M48 family metalloprotease [Holophagales bacterium]|nr:M48 family metalloprotease [Holophagales bacterium]
MRIHNQKLFEKSAKAAQAALAYYGEHDDPEQKQRLLAIGYRLAAHSNWSQFPFSFYLVDMPIPNAFALPGGHIFVTRGMLDLGLDNDMLACLLGHEIAHVVYEHGIKMQKRATLLNILSQAALLGVMIGAEGGPENPRDPYGIERSGSRKGSLVQGTAATGIVFTELLLRKFSRGFEDEADEEGQRLAAAAGFDPAGAHALWQLMNERLPTSEDYGYWRTHPFSDQRLRAAEIRAEELETFEPRSSAPYRVAAQAAILSYRASLPADEVDHQPFDEPVEREPEDGIAKPLPLDQPGSEPWRAGFGAFLDATALDAWPRGPEAMRLRLEQLHRLRASEMEKTEVSRDYGRVIRAYEQHLEAVRNVDPGSDFLTVAGREARELRQRSEELFPRAVEVWNEGFYQTPFLVTFLSNYPDAPQSPDVALALGNAYSRLGRQSSAVEHYLLALAAGPETEAHGKALQGLRNLAPYLDELVALAQLAETVDDAELRQAARARLGERAGHFEKLEHGSSFLRRFPSSPLAETVESRIEKLAQDLYGEVVLYQGLGDHVKALERIQQILEHAPRTPAADALREKAVLDS